MVWEIICSHLATFKLFAHQRMDYSTWTFILDVINSYLSGILCRPVCVERDKFFKNLTDDIIQESEIEDGIQVALGKYPRLGSYYTVPGYVLISGNKEKRLFSRNMILMIKDTMVARLCNSLL